MGDVSSQQRKRRRLLQNIIENVDVALIDDYLSDANSDLNAGVGLSPGSDVDEKKHFSCNFVLRIYKYNIYFHVIPICFVWISCCHYEPGILKKLIRLIRNILNNTMY